MSFHGYDAWRTTPPDDTQPEYDEGDQMEREHEDHMQALAVWIENATGRQIKLGVRLMEDAIRQRIADHAAELKALGAAGGELPRAPRKDKGKPRKRSVEEQLRTAIAVNDTSADADPFEAAR